MEDRLCLECGIKLMGRADKKFCDDSCRNSYNNRLNSDQTNLVRNINNSLRKNRRVLQMIFDAQPDKDVVKVHRDKFNLKGFDFNYITSSFKTKEGKEYRYCYDYGYLNTGGDFFIVVKSKGG
jgi:hypothetical protein